MTGALFSKDQSMINAVADLVRSLRIVDIGANEYEGGGPPPYRPVEASSVSTVVAFDPAVEEAEQISSGKRKWLPLALGDGHKHILHECAAPMTSSLLKPNEEIVCRFENLPQFCKVVARSTIDTVRLDTVPEVANTDFLKIDVQGATLLVLASGTETLKSVLVVHTEVEFAPIYANEPLFGDVHAFLSQHGFEFHHFRDFGSARELDVSGQFAFGRSTSRHLWADAVFVPTEARMKRMDTRQLLLLATIMHDCYGAQDFAYSCLTRLDGKSQTNFADAYRKAVLG